ncbi:C-C motif chemokine 20-like [Kryptolebias marmoratus]|uniref:C-C motif chemokine 20-like n=1 Tax=Kryptolebias marmoratus TaxID=37003 RepID=A0A3Q3A1X0_KRYMA|nr:C-C motif chemokine 20-like [Kryptolebias marmoratus]
MTPGGITMTIILLFFIVGILGPAPAASFRARKSCCTRYQTKAVPFARIKGYREQSPYENCRLSAIIFYTINKHEICANPQDEWVKRILALLSSKLKSMAKTTAHAREVTGKPKTTPTYEGSGGSFNTTDAFDSEDSD